MSAEAYRTKSASQFIELTAAIEIGSAEAAADLYGAIRQLDRSQVV